MTNIGTVTASPQQGLLSQITQSFNKYIVTPANAFGLGGFVFDIEGENTINLDAEITDNYTEDNSPVQDHISLKPQRIILRNYVGELVYRQDKTTNTPTQQVVQKLTIINQYLPVLSSAAAQIKPTLAAVSNIFNGTQTPGEVAALALQPPALNNITNMWAATKNLNPSASRQQQAYLFFKSLYEQKILTSVQTPFEFVTNLAIERIVARQPEDSKYISDFTITLKKIRVAEVKAVTLNPLQYQGALAQQAQDVAKNGNIQGQELTTPALGLVQNFGFLK